MSESAAVVLHEQPTTTDVIVRPAMTVDEAVSQLNQIRDFRKRVLQEGVDYGVIPGTGSKPTLLKPGAEKLAQLFGFTVRFDVVKEVEDWDAGFFYYWYRCIVSQRGTGAVISHGDGSCNSKEDKYRWRGVAPWETPKDKEELAAFIESAHHTKRKKVKGEWATFYYFPNDEPFSLVNTLQKMAQKRAMIAAILIATRASEEFTQDVEDLGEYGGGGDDYRGQQPPAPPKEATDKQIERVRELLSHRLIPQHEREQIEEWLNEKEWAQGAVGATIANLKDRISKREANGNGVPEEDPTQEKDQPTESMDGENGMSEEEEEEEVSEIDRLHDDIRECFNNPDLPEKSRVMWSDSYKGMRRKPRDLDDDSYLEELKRLRKNLRGAITKAKK